MTESSDLTSLFFYEVHRLYDKKGFFTVKFNRISACGKQSNLLSLAEWEVSAVHSSMLQIWWMKTEVMHASRIYNPSSMTSAYPPEPLVSSIYNIIISFEKRNTWANASYVKPRVCLSSLNATWTISNRCRWLIRLTFSLQHHKECQISKFRSRGCLLSTPVHKYMGGIITSTRYAALKNRTY